MKKVFFLLSVSALMLVFACKKDKDTDPMSAKYTDETVEQSKANVQQNAVDFVDQLDALSSAKGIQVIMHLAGMDPVTLQKSALSSPIMQPLSLLRALNDKSQASQIFVKMKSASQLMEGDPVYISDMFDSIAGRYTWNFETQQFDKSALANQVVFEFPGLEADLTNTATVTVDNFTVTDISNPREDWPSGLAPELPTGLRITMKYNTETVAGVSMSASYKSDGMPTKISVQVFVDDFTLTETITHSPYTSASFINTLKFKDEILFETYAAASGDWSQENIDNNIEETEYGTNTHIEEIVKAANAHVILMNLEAIGNIDFKSFGDAMWTIDEQEEQMTQEEAAQARVDALNANAKLIVIYRDSNTKVAEAEAYVDSRYDDYSQTTEYFPAVRFVYADGSKVTAEDYVKGELDGFYTSLNQFIDELNAEYGLDIEHQNPPVQE
jgi:hypothetical protein